MFIHLVYFWLKEDASSEQRDQLAADAHSLLAEIPGVRHIWAGRPAMTPRDIVDNSYDVGLCVILDDKAAHDAYQTHEKHLTFISRHKPYWQRVQVYDFIDQP